MNTPARVKDLFELPESVHRIGFVEVLSEAVRDPRATVGKYVVTPGIQKAFDRALATIGSSVKNRRSQAAFLHGSFGSGKSHFMALLSLMLEANEEAWRLPELHELREKHGFIGKTRFLELHFHIVGQRSLEEAIFARYVAFVREKHPTATVPGLFADAQLFADAARLLDELGEDAFFAQMGAAKDDEWGTVYSRVDLWDRRRFEAAASSSDTKEREALYSALVKSRYSAHPEESRQYIDLDAGLAVIARHAKGLGYDALILFLDEIILWLAHRASDVAWFHNEVQKLVKLVEAQDSFREVPIISFLARQRDLAEMVGKDYAGVENALLQDSLKWSELRYEKITLEDRNLPAIVERRVLRPKNDAAKLAVDQAFERMRATASAGSWQTLLGQLDAKSFRQLYPFSPALVDALVALSNSLQRERTAIRLLTELLVEHIEDLPLGELVGVGDLFDVLAGGEDTADGVMRARFESAKQLYQYQFLPMIQAGNGTTTKEKCQRLRPEHATRLGCAGCPEKACRTDNRLVKTLLVAALVPETTVLKDLTAGRLAQLNHGSLKAPFGGDTASIAAQKLKTWAAKVGQLHVGDQVDPTVRVELEGVDLEPILKSAEKEDSPGARQRIIRDLLFSALGVDRIADAGRDHKQEWRGTSRLGHIRFGNVRKMGPDALNCPDGHDWRVVVNYPFDDKGFGPHDDEAVVERFREESGSWTLVWLPSFFSAEMNQMLGDLVVLEHILESAATTRRYVSHLAVESQARAINDLTNLRSQKQSRVRQGLEQAYGIAKAREGDLDPAASVERHVQVAKLGVVVQTALASSLADALPKYIQALLDARYPRHPQFTKRLTTKRVDELVGHFGAIIDAEEKRIPADRALVEELRGTLGELGLVRTTENAAHLVEDKTLQRIESRRAQNADDRPEVGEVRRWIDEGGKMGLEPEALELVVRCYARWAARTFMSGDRPFEVKGGRPIPDEVVLEKPDLPAADAWSRAHVVADQVLSVSLPGIKSLHADNLKRFEAAVEAAVKAKAPAATKLHALLARRGVELDVAGEVDRSVTARSGDELITALQGKKGKALVEALAAFAPKTSAKALGSSLRSAAEVVATLDNNLVFGTFSQLAARKDTLAGAAELLEHAAKALRQDELNTALAPRLTHLAEAGQALMVVPSPKPNPDPVERVVFQRSLDGRGKSDVTALVEALQAALATVDDTVHVVASIELRLPPKEPK